MRRDIFRARARPSGTRSSRCGFKRDRRQTELVLTSPDWPVDGIQTASLDFEIFTLRLLLTSIQSPPLDCYSYRAMLLFERSRAGADVWPIMSMLSCCLRGTWQIHVIASLKQLAESTKSQAMRYRSRLHFASSFICQSPSQETPRPSLRFRRSKAIIQLWQHAVDDDGNLANGIPSSYPEKRHGKLQ